MKKPFNIASIFMLVLFSKILFADVSYLYISPNGSDNNNGLTISNSLATPIKALKLAREILQNGDDAYLVFSGGHYQIPSTLEVGNFTCNNNLNRLYLVNKENEIPVFSGGKTFVLSGTQNSNGTYSYTLPPDINAIKQLYINGTRVTRARYPNIDAATSNTDTLVGFDSTQNKILMPTSFLSQNKNLIGAVVVVKHTYFASHYVVTGSDSTGVFVDSAAKDIQFGPLSIESSTQGRLRFYIDNALSLLNSPGEFYFDQTSHTLHYMPRGGENAGTIVVTIPYLETIMNIRASSYTNPSLRGNQTCRVTVGGITFAHTSWNYADSNGLIERQGGIYNLATPPLNSTGRPKFGVVPAAISIDNIADVVLIRNTIRDIGGNGVNINNSTYKILLYGNVFKRISNTGVLVDTQQEPYANSDSRVELTHIFGNYFYDMGKDYQSGSGIFATYPNTFVVQNNTIDLVPNLGIHVGWMNYSDPNTILQSTYINRNKISRAAYDASDSGAIHTKNRNPNSLISENYITTVNTTTSYPTGNGKGQNGIYIDNYSYDYSLVNNVMSQVGKNIHLNNESTLTPMTFNSVFDYNNLVPASCVANIQTSVQYNAGVDATRFADIDNASPDGYIGGSFVTFTNIDEFTNILYTSRPDFFKRADKLNGVYLQNFSSYTRRQDQVQATDCLPSFVFYNTFAAQGNLSIIDASSNPKLQIVDIGTTGIVRQKIGTPLTNYTSGIITTSVSFKALQTTGSLYLNLINLDNTFATSTTEIASFGFSNSGSLLTLNVPSVSAIRYQSYQANVVYNLKLVLNLNSGNLDAYINDAKLGSTINLPITQLPITLDSINITAEAGSGTFVIDDFKVQPSEEVSTVIRVNSSPASALTYRGVSGFRIYGSAESMISGYVLAYQWQVSNTVDGLYADITNQVSANLLIDTSQLGTKYYRLKFTATNMLYQDTLVTYSNVATISVLAQSNQPRVLPTIIEQPIGPSTPIGRYYPNTTTLYARASCPSYATVSYNWQSSVHGQAGPWTLRQSGSGNQFLVLPTGYAITATNQHSPPPIPAVVYVRVRALCNYASESSTNIYSNMVTIQVGSQ